MYTQQPMLQPDFPVFGLATIDASSWLIPFFATEHDGPQRNRSTTSADKRKKLNAGNNRNRVLLFSGIWEVALYRAEVLRTNGFQVLLPQSKEEAIQVIKGGDLDIAVLTYTLPNETVHELADLLRESCPGCPLVTISDSGRVDRKIAPDATVIANQGPAGLIQALRRFTKLNL